MAAKQGDEYAIHFHVASILSNFGSLSQELAEAQIVTL